MSLDTVDGSRARGGLSRRGLPPLAPALLPAESSFYGRYRWCLNAFPSVADLRQRLRDELSKLKEVPEDRGRDEVLSNVFLLSCALADSVDDYLAGDRYDLSQAAAAVACLAPPGQGGGRVGRGRPALARAAFSRVAAVARLRRWRDQRGM